MTALFRPLALRGTTFPHRVWVSPMCQYSCDPVSAPGVPTDWHLVHLGAFAVGGFALVSTEATAVSPEGRISPQDTGIWNDEQRRAWSRIVRFIHDQGVLAGIQLAHAGRKASTYRPWSPQRGSVPLDLGGWPAVGPTDSPFGSYARPEALDLPGIDAVVRAFADAAARALEAGFDVVEVHAGHGYLLHEFLSPLVNTRDDAYGGTAARRSRLLLEVVDAVRTVWPDERPVLVRISATDWVDGGWDVEASVTLAATLLERGVDLVDCSSGGVVPGTDIPVGQGYQVPLAEQIRRRSGMPTAAVGLITTAAQAEEIVAEGRADVVVLARAALRDPRWPRNAAAALGVPPRDAPPWPSQYLRAAPTAGRPAAGPAT